MSSKLKFTTNLPTQLAQGLDYLDGHDVLDTSKNNPKGKDLHFIDLGKTSNNQTPVTFTPDIAFTGVVQPKTIIEARQYVAFLDIEWSKRNQTLSDQPPDTQAFYRRLEQFGNLNTKDTNILYKDKAGYRLTTPTALVGNFLPKGSNATQLAGSLAAAAPAFLERMAISVAFQAAGTAMGAALGTVAAPGVGTAIGSSLGSAFGSAAGEIAAHYILDPQGTDINWGSVASAFVCGLPAGLGPLTRMSAAYPVLAKIAWAAELGTTSVRGHIARDVVFALTGHTITAKINGQEITAGDLAQSVAMGVVLGQTGRSMGSLWQKVKPGLGLHKGIIAAFEDAETSRQEPRAETEAPPPDTPAPPSRGRAKRVEVQGTGPLRTAVIPITPQAEPAPAPKPAPVAEAPRPATAPATRPRVNFRGNEIEVPPLPRASGNTREPNFTVIEGAIRSLFGTGDLFVAYNGKRCPVKPGVVYWFGDTPAVLVDRSIARPGAPASPELFRVTEDTPELNFVRVDGNPHVVRVDANGVAVTRLNGPQTFTRPNPTGGHVVTGYWDGTYFFGNIQPFSPIAIRNGTVTSNVYWDGTSNMLSLMPEVPTIAKICENTLLACDDGTSAMITKDKLLACINNEWVPVVRDRLILDSRHGWQIVAGDGQSISRATDGTAGFIHNGTFESGVLRQERHIIAGGQSIPWEPGTLITFGDPDKIYQMTSVVDRPLSDPLDDTLAIKDHRDAYFRIVRGRLLRNEPGQYFIYSDGRKYYVRRPEEPEPVPAVGTVIPEYFEYVNELLEFAPIAENQIVMHDGCAHRRARGNLLAMRDIVAYRAHDGIYSIENGVATRRETNTYFDYNGKKYWVGPLSTADNDLPTTIAVPEHGGIHWRSDDDISPLYVKADRTFIPVVDLPKRALTISVPQSGGGGSSRYTWEAHYDGNKFVAIHTVEFGDTTLKPWDNFFRWLQGTRGTCKLVTTGQPDQTIQINGLFTP